MYQYQLLVVATCISNASYRLEDLRDVMPLICKCCSIVPFKHMNHPLIALDSTMLPCCVPQLFDLQELQDDLMKVFVAGKHLLQDSKEISVSFYFKEQRIAQSIPGNM